ncbi:hypothetical protein BFR04_05680 [Gaetbulibacter sp. 4G1]|nr:oligosaccharide flippase family protein [Gaetbulibacter sp. 4G1]PIA79011.1 hypothetical protein BFR04_05680 [Gaetbulibacter sp. 4G1]
MKLSKEALSLLSNSAWSLFGTFISKGLMFFAWVIVANILGKTINGEIGVLRSTINLFIAFVGTGFGITLTKYLSKYKDEETERTSKILSLTLTASFFFGIIISLTYYILSPWIANKVLAAPHLLYVIRINTFLLFFSIMNGVFLGCLQGFEKFKTTTWINSVFGVCLFIFLFFGASNNQITGVFWGFIFATIISLVLSIYYTSKTIVEYKIKLTTDFLSEIRILKHFTVPAILSGLMVVPFKWILETLLVRQENGYSEMGLFSALFLFHTLLLMIVNTVNAPMIITMSNSKKNIKLEKLNILLPWAFGVLVALPVLFFPEILGIFFGSDYLKDENYRTTVIFIILITVLVLFKNGMARIMIVNNLMWFSFVSNLVWGIVLVSAFYFNPVKDSVTLALSYAIAYVINILISVPFYVYKKIIPMSIIYSKLSIFVWFFFLFLVYVIFNGLDLDNLSKVILLTLFFIIFCLCFYKMFLNEEKNFRD